MNVLVACEFSGVVRDAFRALGHNAWSCDLLESEGDHHWHYQCDVRYVLRGGTGAYFAGFSDGGVTSWMWDMMIAHPPCTYLTRSGWHWVNKPDCSVEPLKGEPRKRAAFEAAKFFRALLDAPIPRIAIENPRPISHVNLPEPTQTIQPWMFGHGETKATCLWLKNLPLLQATHRRDDLFCEQEPKEREHRIHLMPPGPDRWKERSRTFTGIAKAMAEQWGRL